MANPAGVRLVQACEALCDHLRRSIGLTSFRIELARRTTPLVVSLRAFEPVAAGDPRHDWMRPSAPARLELDLRDGDTYLGTILVEDSARESYSGEAQLEGERIAGIYVPELRTLLAETAL